MNSAWLVSASEQMAESLFDREQCYLRTKLKSESIELHRCVIDC